MPSSDQLPYPLVIHVVDDSTDTAESLAELLALQGHRVVTSFCGEDALENITANPPDVVLLDIRMPGLNGCQVARLIREQCASRGKRPFLVAVTGCGTDEDRHRSAEAGFDLHLVKPVDPAMLVGLLERYRRLLAPSTPQPPDEGVPPEVPPDNRSKTSHWVSYRLWQPDEPGPEAADSSPTHYCG